MLRLRDVHHAKGRIARFEIMDDLRVESIRVSGLKLVAFHAFANGLVVAMF